MTEPINIKEATIIWADGNRQPTKKAYTTFRLLKTSKEVKFELDEEVSIYSFSEIQKVKLENGMTFQLQNLNNDTST